MAVIAADRPMPVGSDGLDLRMTWPERQLLIRRDNYRRGLRELADVELPFLPDFIQQVGGAMPQTYDSLHGTQFVSRLEAFWTQHARRGVQAVEVCRLLLNAAARYAYLVEWWEYEGRRSYALDPITAHALMHTHLEEFPVSALRLPVRSFFLRIPQDLGWTVSLENRPDVNLSVPLDRHPEPIQPLDGIHVGCDMVNGELKQLQVVIAGRSRQGPEGDHCIWGEIKVEGAETLGQLINQELAPVDAWAATAADLDRRVLRMALGTILYITSSHPELRPIEPPASKTLAKAEKSDNPERRARALERSRYTITYVGGPNAGFREAARGATGPLGYTRKPPKPHVRVGHMRHVWVGPRESPSRHTEIRWIQPVMVGSWDRLAAYNAEKGYQIAIGKTRPAMIVNQ